MNIGLLSVGFIVLSAVAVVVVVLLAIPMTRNNKALLVAAIVAVLAIAYVKTRETPFEEKLSRMIQLSVDAANAKNQQAVSMCESEINAILAQQFSVVTRQGLLIAQDIAHYGSCCKTIYSLARHTTKTSNTTAQHAHAGVES